MMIKTKCQNQNHMDDPIKPRQNQKLDDPKLTAASSGMSVVKPWRWAKWQDAESNSRPEAARGPGE